jgi:hypothetical protein
MLERELGEVGESAIEDDSVAQSISRTIRARLQVPDRAVVPMVAVASR